MTQVAAQRPAPERAAASGGELLADRRARRLAGVALRDQRRARLVDERLDLRRAHADHLGDLLVREVGQLCQHERRALIMGQALDVRDQRPQIGPRLHLLAQPLRRQARRVDVGLEPASAEQREAAVARDRVQPRPEVRRRPALAQRPVGAQEGLLQRVLGLLASAHHVAAEAQQGAVVAVVEDLERPLVARRCHVREPAVGEPPEQERSESGVAFGDRGHGRGT